MLINIRVVLKPVCLFWETVETKKKSLGVKHSFFLLFSTSRLSRYKGDADRFHGNVSVRDHQSLRKGQPRVLKHPRPGFFGVALCAGRTAPPAQDRPLL